ncbi:MAG: hypothetical protein J0H15_00950 [Xanthomonadales bacterium]|nr:hypothetical protein [Xanthomonadales bacterium]
MRAIVSAVLVLAATCTAPAWALDINGKTIGMSIDEVAQGYGKRWTCETASDARAGDRICSKSTAVDEFPRMQNENFAGTHVAISYRFHDDRLVQIRVSGISKGRYDGVLDTLKKAYGEPQLETGSAQSKSGKTFDRNIARWKDDGAVLDLSTNTPKPPLVSLALYDAEYWKPRDAAAPAVDGG